MSLVPDLESKRVPRGFFNSLESSRKPVYEMLNTSADFAKNSRPKASRRALSSVVVVMLPIEGSKHNRRFGV